MRKTVKDRRHLAIAAACLYSEKMLQSDIATQLNISQPDVSRLLRAAEKEYKIINIHPTLIRSKITDQEWEAVQREFFSDKQLTEKINSWLPKGRKVSIRVSGESDEEFCSLAAERMFELMANSKVTGVLWGRTIRRIVGKMQEQVGSGFTNKSIECIPLCGDPIHAMNQDNQNFSASHLAADLEKVLTGEFRRSLPSLSVVPAYLPASLVEVKKGTAPVIFKDFIHNIPGYRRIFLEDTNGPFVDRVDTVLSGVGIVGLEGDQGEGGTGTFLRERINQEGISTDELNRLVVGDFGGILIPKAESNESAQLRVAKLNAGWLGIGERQIRRIAQTSVETGRPGVIVLAQGARKAEIIRECVIRGLVSELIVNLSLAHRLKSLH